MKLHERATERSSTSTTATATRTSSSSSSVTSPASTSGTTASTTVNTTPFFAGPSSLTKPTSAAEHAQDLSKSIVEWVFLGIAIVLLTYIVVFRLWQMRRRNQPFTQFFSFNSSPPSPGRPRNIPRTTGLPSISIPLTHVMLYPPLDPLPVAYSHGRRTRAADTDAGGRRAGPNGDDGGQKEMLPAYEGGGGPPKYMELEMMDRMRRLHLNLAGVVGRDADAVTPAHRRDAEDQPVREGSSSLSHEPPSIPQPPLTEPGPENHHDPTEP